MLKDLLKFVGYTWLIGWAGGKLFSTGIDLGLKAAEANRESE